MMPGDFSIAKQLFKLLRTVHAKRLQPVSRLEIADEQGELQLVEVELLRVGSTNNVLGVVCLCLAQVQAAIRFRYFDIQWQAALCRYDIFKGQGC